MTVEYSQAPAVANIAAKLIAQHHPHLHGVRIEYVFRPEATKSGGKTILRALPKIGGLNAFLVANATEEPDGDPVEDFFVIEIAYNAWEVLSPAQRVALVDHELSHCTTDFDKDDEIVLKLKAHDLEEFTAVVERHGLWMPDVRDFAIAAKEQLTLLDEAGGPDPDDEHRD